ncbi:MAG: SixA phosphatase family protein, partial [Gammaproteobacteria bacterium]
AKSDWSHDHLEDHDRPLARRGLRDAPRMGDRLAHRGIKPDLLLTSSARRAVDTAKLVEPAIRHAALTVQVEPTIYLASPREMLDLLAEQSNELDEILLVGHNPGLTELINRLLPSLALANLPTAGVAAFESTAEDWAGFASAELKLLFLDYPKNSAH